MAIERWGAFSVIDHKDKRKLAADVLLYDRLVLPSPTDWDFERWEKNKWDPQGMRDTLGELGEIAVPVRWDLAQQGRWKAMFNALEADTDDFSVAYAATRRVLADQARNYLPPGVNAVEVCAAYQSEADFDLLNPELDAEFNFLVAQRLAVPDGEDALRRALDLTADPKFKQRRGAFRDWQADILNRGILPVNAARELTSLVADYNAEVQRSCRSYRVETAMLVAGLSATALAVLASTAPALFVGVGIGVLQGAKVISIGSATTGAVLNIARHQRGKKEPDAGNQRWPGAMFHQVEDALGWGLRVG